MNISISPKIGRIRRAFRAEFERRAASLEITKAQYRVLARLWRGDGISPSIIARDVGVSASTMTGILDRLESKNLIWRTIAAGDRRAVDIWLTDSGRAMEKPLRKIIGEINCKAMKGFSEEQQRDFLQNLDKVGDNLEHREK